MPSNNPHSSFSAIPSFDLSTWSDTWKHHPIQENYDPLIDIRDRHKSIHYTPMYHTLKITGAITSCYVRKSLFSKLIVAVDILQSLQPNYSFLVYDAWRPETVQQSLFDDYKTIISQQHPAKTELECVTLTEQFVSLPSTNPLKPSPHITGGSIDLTILDANGNPLNMGTHFDSFTNKAHTDFFEDSLNKNDTDGIKVNRRLLYQVMTQAGFTNFPFEWWHFDYGNQFWASLSKQPYAFYGQTKPS